METALKNIQISSAGSVNNFPQEKCASFSKWCREFCVVPNLGEFREHPYLRGMAHRGGGYAIFRAFQDAEPKSQYRCFITIDEICEAWSATPSAGACARGGAVNVRARGAPKHILGVEASARSMGGTIERLGVTRDLLVLLLPPLFLFSHIFYFSHLRIDEILMIIAWVADNELNIKQPSAAAEGVCVCVHVCVAYPCVRLWSMRAWLWASLRVSARAGLTVRARRVVDASAGALAGTSVFFQRSVESCHFAR